MLVHTIDSNVIIGCANYIVNYFIASVPEDGGNLMLLHLTISEPDALSTVQPW